MNRREREILSTFQQEPGIKMNERLKKITDEERQKIIILYHQNKRWTWGRIAYEVYKEKFPNVRLYGREEYDIFGVIPEKYINRVRFCVGRHLMNVCRAEEACPFKALLPEYEFDIQEEKVNE